MLRLGVPHVHIAAIFEIFSMSNLPEHIRRHLIYYPNSASPQRQQRAILAVVRRLVRKGKISQEVFADGFECTVTSIAYINKRPRRYKDKNKKGKMPKSDD